MNNPDCSDKIDWMQVKVLVWTGLQLDLRGSAGTGRLHVRVPSLVWNLIFYGFMGLAVSGTLVTSTNLQMYGLLVLAYSMLMMAFSVILEFSNSLFLSDDADILFHRPMHSRTYFFARAIHVSVYILGFGSVLVFFPAVFLGFHPDAGWMFVIPFYLTATVAHFFTAFAMILFYSFLFMWVSPERLKDILAYIQIGIVFVMMLSYQVIPRLGPVQHMAQLPTWIGLLPPAWFLGLLRLLTGDVSPQALLFAAPAVVITGIFVPLFMMHVSSRYLGDLQKFADLRENNRKRTSDKKTGTTGLPDRIVEKLLKNYNAVTGYRMTTFLMRHDRSLKMGLYPVFGLPLALMIISILDGSLGDPFVQNIYSLQNNMNVMAVFFIYFMIYFFLTGLLYIRDWNAAWIFFTAPVRKPGQFYRGVKTAVFIRFMLPFYLILGLIYAFRIPWGHAFRHMMGLLLIGLLAFSAVGLTLRDFPFSRKRERGERMRRMGFVLFAPVFLVITMAMQRLAYPRPASYWISQAAVLMLFVLLETWSEYRLNRILTRKEYFGFS